MADDVKPVDVGKLWVGDWIRTQDGQVLVVESLGSGSALWVFADAQTDAELRMTHLKLIQTVAEVVHQSVRPEVAA